MRQRLAAVALCAVCAVPACSREETAPASGPAQSTAREAAPEPLPELTVPDFSTLPPAVRTQLETAAIELRTRTEQAGADSAALATAQGEFGQLLMAAGFRTTAAAYFTHAEAHAPRDLRWPYYLGHIHRSEGRAVESAAAFERAVRADGSYMPALVWLGDAYLDQGRPDDAAPLFARALELEPDTVAAVYGLGRVALARRDFKAAAYHFERALALDPSAEAVHQPLGLAYRGLGQMDRAKAHLSRQAVAAEIRPPDPLDVGITVETAVGYDVRATRAMDAGDWKAATEFLGRAVELAPEDPALRHRYATALALHGDIPGARQELDLLTRRWPDFEKGQYSLGLMKADAGDIAGARTAFERAIEAAPTYLEPRLQLAHLLRRTGDSAAALPEYVRVLERDPRVIEARFGRAMALVSLGRYADAREQLEEGRTLHPEVYGFTLALARVLAAAPDQAVRDGARAVRIVDAIPAPERRIEWAIVRAMALAEAGRVDEAIRLQQAAIVSLEQNGSPDLARHQTEVLRMYEKRQPRRSPWRPDEPMELP